VLPQALQLLPQQSTIVRERHSRRFAIRACRLVLGDRRKRSREHHEHYSFFQISDRPLDLMETGHSYGLCLRRLGSRFGIDTSFGFRRAYGSSLSGHGSRCVVSWRLRLLASQRMLVCAGEAITVAAFFHRAVLRDGVLQRMLPLSIRASAGRWVLVGTLGIESPAQHPDDDQSASAHSLLTANAE
jgi:hypothetical protein